MSRRRGYVHACPAFQHKSSGSSSRTCERSQPQAFYCSQTLIDVENSDTKCHCILFLRLCPSTCASSFTLRHLWIITGTSIIRGPFIRGFQNDYVSRCRRGTLSGLECCLVLFQATPATEPSKRVSYTHSARCPGARAAVLIVRTRRKRQECFTKTLSAPTFYVLSLVE